MQDTQLYQRILGLERPWSVSDVRLDVEKLTVDVHVEHSAGVTFGCPECGRELGVYDHADERGWRHLDTCQFRTLLHARIPRVQCPEHGVKQVAVPWAGKHSRFTLLMESLVISTLQACQTVERAAALLGISWDQAQAVMQRAVERGRRRKTERAHTEPVESIGVDEKAVRKGHSYMTIVSDLDRGCVEHVQEDRTVDSLADYYKSLSEPQKQAIRSVAMDMWRPYIRATRDHLPEAEQKIVFDRFHVMKLAGDAVDRVRRQEHKRLKQQGDDTLTGTKYLWLYAEQNLPEHRVDEFDALKALNLKTARAWAIKEMLGGLWEYSYVASARKYFERWYGWARRSQLPPIKKLAKTVRDHLENILTYCKHGITNAVSEGINSTIMAIKRQARGFRNPQNFKTAIYFYCGRLELHP